MLRWLINRRIDKTERELGASLDYLRHIQRTAPRAFFKFLKLLPLAGYRGKLPPAALHVAAIVATRLEDCGACVQMAVNMAVQEGVSRDVLRAACAGAPDELPPDLADVYRFAEAVVMQAADQAELRERIRQQYGEEELVELSLAISVSRVFPTVKRGLGYATSCALAPVEV